MSTNASGGRKYLTFELIPNGKVGPGGRQEYDEVLRGVGTTADAAMKMACANLPPPEEHWVEALETYLVKPDGSRSRRVRTWYYPHGPLGYLDTGYAKGLVRHPLTCEKCEALRARHPQWTAAKWEALEAMVTDKTCSREEFLKRTGA